MKVYRISKCNFIDDLSGTGAAIYGGRWNSKSVYLLYTSQSPALALLETIVHLTEIAAATYCMATIEIPVDDIEELRAVDLPLNWQRNPPLHILKQIGDRFVAGNKSLALKIPSSIMPEENNILINPRHVSFKDVRLKEVKPSPLDSRLLRKVD